MTSRKSLLIAVAGVVLLGSGCSNKSDKCEKAVTKAFNMATEMMASFATAMGGKAAADPEAKKVMDEKMAEMKKQMESKKPEAVKACVEELKANKDAEKVIDCMISAKDIGEIQKCDPAGSVNFLNKMK